MLRGRDAGGSVLVLVPSGFLVLILLSALAVDSAVAYLAQQRLHDALTAAANDAVAAGLDNGTFYAGGALTLDPATVQRAVCQTIDAQRASGLQQLKVAVAISGLSIQVSGSATVSAVFGRALPGFGHRSVRSTAGATLAASTSSAAARFGPPTVLRC
ncbi:MAG: hypothetical protein JO337_14055 [Acidimicrobiales bacterium]|nr:hypothetical protein [Acidimicrobiales bacterium]